jgi:hypothetical protein
MSGMLVRREPVFTEWSRPGSSASRSLQGEIAPPIAARAGPGQTTGAKPDPSSPLRVTPWLGLALAALILAAPSFTPGSIASRLATPSSPARAAPGPSVRIAGEDEVVFGTFALRLSGASSADELWRRWTDLKQRQLGYLDELTPMVRPVGGPGSGFSLLVGEFRNAAAAADACGTLRARFVACEVVHRSGVALNGNG